MANPRPSTNEIGLHHSNQWMYYRIARDENGGLIWKPGVAPDMTPQVRETSFNYSHIPPQISTVIPFETWERGAGFVDGDETGYSYSQGIDASWGDRLYLSPALHEVENLASAPTHFARTRKGVFASAGRYLYRFNTGTGQWVEVEDLGAGEAFTGPVVEFNNLVLAPAGDDLAYRYSTDGLSWTASTLTDDEGKAHLFAVRGESSNTPQMWKILSDGALSVTADPTNTGSWSLDTQMGHEGETAVTLLVAADKIFSFTDSGVHSYDGTNMEDVFLSPVADAANGTAYHWIDGHVYAWYGSLLMMDPEENLFVSIFPSREQYGHPELGGAPGGITGDGTHLYMTTNGPDGTYVMKGRPGEAWHTWAYIESTTAGPILYAPIDDVLSTSPVIITKNAVLGAGMYRLPKANLRPEDDSAYRFVTHGEIWGSYHDAGAKGFEKFLTSFTLLAENLAVGRYVEIHSEVDTRTDHLHELRAELSGKHEHLVTDEIGYNRIRYHNHLHTNTATKSPIVRSVLVTSTYNNPRKRMWTVGLVVGPNEQMVGGGSSYDSALALENHLFDGLTAQVVLRDRSGREYRVRILDIDTEHSRPVRLEDRDLLIVTMAEV